MNALSVIENLCLAQRLAGLTVDKSKAKTYWIIEYCSKGKRICQSLKPGRKTRMAIARALINSPALILADEPTSALDDTNAKEVLALLQDVVQESNAVF